MPERLTGSVSYDTINERVSQNDSPLATFNYSKPPIRQIFRSASAFQTTGCGVVVRCTLQLVSRSLGLPLLRDRRQSHRLRRQRTCGIRSDPRPRPQRAGVLCAFDLLEVNGQDIRSEPIEDRKRRLAGLTPPASWHRPQFALPREWRGRSIG
jgi:hypothetical protein